MDFSFDVISFTNKTASYNNFGEFGELTTTNYSKIFANFHNFHSIAHDYIFMYVLIDNNMASWIITNYSSCKVAIAISYVRHNGNNASNVAS